MKINLDRRSSLSIDRQIFNQIRRLIIERSIYAYRPLTLPNDLASELGCSVDEVNLAYQKLIEENYIYQSKNQNYWIKNPEGAKNILSENNSMYVSIERLGLKPSLKTISQKVVDVSTIKNYPLVQKQQKVLHVERVYYADETAVAFVDSYFSLSLFPEIDNYDFKDETYFEIFKKRYKVKAARIDRTFYATKVEDRIASVLKLDKGSVCLTAEISSYDENENLLEFSSFIENLQNEWVTSSTKLDEFY